MSISGAGRRRLLDFALLIGSLLMSLLLAELATRLFLGHTIVLFPRYFTEAHYGGVTLRRLTPNSTFWHTSVDGRWEFRINAQGFRDDNDYQYAKPNGMRRILVLGDSHAQGFEARQSAIFAKVLERRLHDRGVETQVLNMGMSGFGTAEELMLLEYEGMKYHPDAVVLAYFDNDIDDNVKSGLYKTKDGNLFLCKTQHTPGVVAIRLMNAIPGASWLGQNSYLFSLFVNTLWEIAKRGFSVMAKEQLTTEYAIRISDIGEYERELSVALLGRIKAITRAAEIPFLIVEIPSVDPNDHSAWLQSVPKELAPSMVALSDIFLPASTYLSGTEEGSIHVPHGHRHVSEQTHARIAEALDRALAEASPLFR